MIRDPQVFYVVHNGSTIDYLTDNLGDAERLRDKKQVEWPVLTWQVTRLDRFGQWCWEDGVRASLESLENTSAPMPTKTERLVLVYTLIDDVKARIARNGNEGDAIRALAVAVEELANVVSALKTEEAWEAMEE